MTKAILRYVLYLPINLAVTALVFVLAPVVALPIFVREGEDGREWYVPWLAWASTHDTPVDTYAYGRVGRTHWLLKRFKVEPGSVNPGWLRYMNRLLWLWRNPAYWFKHHTLGLRHDHQGIFLYERKFRYLHVQFGWKVYRNDPDGKRMYAFRLKPELKEGWS